MTEHFVSNVGEEGAEPEPLRLQAIAALKRKRDFRGHVLVYLLVNAALVTVWAATSAGFFWPIFPIVFWGIGVVMNGWDVYFGQDFSEERIEHEMEHLANRR
jgi:hypothetical protein